MQLDLIFARAELGDQMDAIRPQVRRDGVIRLRKARHPLLDKKDGIPIDIELGVRSIRWSLPAPIPAARRFP